MPNGINIPIATPQVRTLFDVLNTLRAQRIREQQLKGAPVKFAPGAAGIVQGEKAIEEKYGKGSPEAAKAKLWNETVNYEKGARGDYYEANVALKNMPTLQKMQIIRDIQKKTGLPVNQIGQYLKGDVNPEPMTTSPQGAVEGSENPNTITNPGSQANVMHNLYTLGQDARDEMNEEIKQTEAKVAKDVGNPAAQAQLPPLIDIAKRVNAIDFTPVAKYAGLHGKVYAMLERAKTMTRIGHVTPEFKAYDLFVGSQGKQLADAARQALKTSVRFSYVRHMIMPLANPAVWYENPELAMNRFNYFRDWLYDRMKLYHHMATQGFSPNYKQMADTLGIGKPTDQQIKDVPPAPEEDVSKMSTAELLRLKKELE